VDTRAIGVGLTTLVLLLGASRAAWAARTDVIVLRNGDHITGEVEQMRQGKLVVKPTMPARCRSSGTKSPA
jgi:hypothetical protein